MLYDWHAGAPAARCFDALTGQRIPLVLSYDDATHRVVRREVDANGRVAPTPGTDVVPLVTETRRLTLEWLPDPD